MGNWGYEVRLPPFRPFIIASDRCQKRAIRVMVESHFSEKLTETTNHITRPHHNYKTSAADPTLTHSY